MSPKFPDRPPLSCPTCGAPYHPTRGWQRFCSVACRNTYHNEREEAKRAGERTKLQAFREDYDALLLEVDQLRRENKELKEEVARLR
jgi:predicted nucleic acid-binding Zn ribbon protein